MTVHFLWQWWDGDRMFTWRPRDLFLISRSLTDSAIFYTSEKTAAALSGMDWWCKGQHLSQHRTLLWPHSKSVLSFLHFRHWYSFPLPMSQGLYVFVVYFILHNQLCCPVKASYTVDMNGHTTPGSAFFTHGSGLPAAGGEISKSTQNLISAMEEVTVL